MLLLYWLHIIYWLQSIFYMNYYFTAMKRIIICFVLISICFAGCKKVEVKQKRNPYGLAVVSDINVYKKQIAEEPK